MRYDDGLTDLQFSRIIESGKDFNQELDRLRRSREAQEMIEGGSQEEEEDEEQEQRHDDKDFEDDDND